MTFATILLKYPGRVATYNVANAAFFDITFWGAHPPTGAVRRALASNTLG